MSRTFFQNNRPCYLSWSRLGFWRIAALAVHVGAAMVFLILFVGRLENAASRLEIGWVYSPDLLDGLGDLMIALVWLFFAVVFIVAGQNRLFSYLGEPRK